MFIGKLTKSHKSWKENNESKSNINDYYGKCQIKTLGRVFDDTEQTKQEMKTPAHGSGNHVRDNSLSDSADESCIDTVAEVHKSEEETTKKKKYFRKGAKKNTNDRCVEIMNKKNAMESNNNCSNIEVEEEKEREPVKGRDFSRVRQKLKLTKLFRPAQHEIQQTESREDILEKEEIEDEDIDIERADQALPSIVINSNVCESDFKVPEIEFSQVNEIRSEAAARNLCATNKGFVGDEDSNRKRKRRPPQMSPADVNKEDMVSKSVGIQATPFPPFRLHFLPEEDWRQTDDKLQRALKLVLSQCGLACVVLTWAMLGALMFRLTEGPQETFQVAEMTRQQSALVVGLATDLRQVIPQEPFWRQTIERYAAQHESLILSAVSSGYPQRGTIWTYPGSLLFATSLLTTLGFGAPVPRTVVGRMCAIIFAGLGIPVHLLLVLNIGLLIAVKLTRLANILEKKAKRVKLKIHRVQTRENDDKESWPEELFACDRIMPPFWLKFFPFVAIPTYYLTGFLLFGLARGKEFPEIFLFPLDFTAAGGVASTYGPLRIAYAMYLEGAVILASTNVALLRVSATRGFTTAAIKMGLMTNSHR
ncbi:uncharacterized protein LOC111047747 [Nilaparvata lugens]|uniref:uncharacterized protein LOC111047747 n=1 Tax=Nilaparvata lugens TaxID=108931 RepID=UPI00193E6AF4|nr:uncharacterized protein LOC111047747 [Nilaparvata lugens]XP_039279574.1 uncharacterized protein LOC111047747 [Nilaparvata lugens]